MEKLHYLPEWVAGGIIYHIYPFGFFGAPESGKDYPQIVNRLEKIRNYYSHFQQLGINIIQFGPLFESERHGYDIIDYMKIDHRLGTIELFKEIVKKLHQLNIRVILDGVFNHVGRGFSSFKDIQEHREKSWKKHWHIINFQRDSPYHDGFDYANWEGHYDLVKLNLEEREVKNYIFSVATFWLKEMDINGWRLDVAYQISPQFWKEFREVCKSIKRDCFLLGEMIHGPYTKWVGKDLLDAGTGYQVHKSIWSALNSNNMFELKAVLERSFHPQWGVHKDICLMNFLGNHDTTRIRSQLKNDNYLFPAFLFLFTLNGIPKIYYGDEIGMRGIKTTQSDNAVRQEMNPDPSKWPDRSEEILNHVKLCITLRKSHHALQYGELIPLFADNDILAFLRRSSQEILLIILSKASVTRSCNIPLWRQDLNNRRFVEILEQGGDKEYRVKNNQLHIQELFPCWGRVLSCT